MTRAMEARQGVMNDAGGRGIGFMKIDVALLIVAVLATYANSFKGAFQFDDFRMIVDNPAVRGFAAWHADAVKGGIRPFLKLTYVLAPSAGGTFWFHLLNVSAHTS